MTAFATKQSVLVVGVDKVSRTALSRLLAQLGFEAIPAGNLAAARKVLDARTPDMLILDLMLPDGDGAEILDEVRQAQRPIRVAVVTAVTDKLRLHEVTARRPDALFGKPIDLADFRDWLTMPRPGLESPAIETPPPSQYKSKRRKPLAEDN